MTRPHGRQTSCSARNGAGHFFRQIPGKPQKLDKLLLAVCGML